MSGLSRRGLLLGGLALFLFGMERMSDALKAVAGERMKDTLARLTKEAEVYAAVTNLFDRENGLWVRDDAIYPIDFERTWKVGARVTF